MLGTGGQTMEVRPIDANKLKEVGIDTSLLRADCKEMAEAIFTAMQSAIDAQPTLDYEPVVRCKDCKHRYMLYDRLMCKRTAKKVEDEKYGINDYWGLIAVTENHFCSYGVKMDEEVKSNANNNS